MLVLLMVASLAFVCDQSYAPVIRNTLDEPVQLEITYSNGTSFSGDYPPGATIYAPAEGLDLERVEVRAGSRPPIELSKVELARLRAEVGPEDRVIWNISEDGIRPAELSE
jgi:hypothetical protein